MATITNQLHYKHSITKGPPEIETPPTWPPAGGWWLGPRWPARRWGLRSQSLLWRLVGWGWSWDAWRRDLRGSWTVGHLGRTSDSDCLMAARAARVTKCRRQTLGCFPGGLSWIEQALLCCVPLSVVLLLMVLLMLLSLFSLWLLLRLFYGTVDNKDNSHRVSHFLPYSLRVNRSQRGHHQGDSHL